MEAVFGLLMVLLGVANGVETYCDGRQNGTQCYGALGGTAILQLMTDASVISSFKWSKNKATTILRVRRNKTVSNEIRDRSSFTASNGTFRINNLSRTDSAEYSLIMYDSEGKPSKERTLQLTIQAPVSSPNLVSECSSQGETRVSCSSEGGDRPQYSWTLDGHTLTDAELLSGNNDSVNITLTRGRSGRLLCTVWNHVSNATKELQIATCEGFILINCTLSNGTAVYDWVLEANNTLCVNPTTTPTTTPSTTPMSTMGKEPGTTVSSYTSPHITSANQTVDSFVSKDSWFIRYLPAVIGSLSALVIVLVVAVAVYCAHGKKQDKKETDNEDDQDVTYADVRFAQRHEKRRPVQMEMEVEYGQIRFSGRPKRTVELPADDSLYAVVRKTQRS